MPAVFAGAPRDDRPALRHHRELDWLMATDSVSSSVYDYSARPIAGEVVSLSADRARVCLMGTLGHPRDQWNLTKFLVDRAGAVRRRYGPKRPLAEIEPEIMELLAQ